MSDLLYTILCSTSIAIILKINGNRKGNIIHLLTGNYLSASVMSLILFSTTDNASYSKELIPIGFFLSLLFVGSIFTYSKSVQLSGAALSTVSSRLSVLIPIILSIILFNDTPTTIQFIGLVTTIVTISLFYYSIKKEMKLSNQVKKFIYLIGVMLGIGFADFFMKVFQENWSLTYKPIFLFWIFFFSFILTFCIAIYQKQKVDKKALSLGIVMGLPNIFSSYFLIESLKTYSAVFVYPIVNMSIIVATAIIVKIFWKEYWNTFSKVAIFCGIISIILLSL